MCPSLQVTYVEKLVFTSICESPAFIHTKWHIIRKSQAIATFINHQQDGASLFKIYFYPSCDLVFYNERFFFVKMILLHCVKLQQSCIFFVFNTKSFEKTFLDPHMFFLS